MIPKLCNKSTLCSYCKVVCNSKGMVMSMADTVGQLDCRQGKYT